MFCVPHFFSIFLESPLTGQPDSTAQQDLLQKLVQVAKDAFIKYVKEPNRVVIDDGSNSGSAASGAGRTRTEDDNDVTADRQVAGTEQTADNAAAGSAEAREWTDASIRRHIQFSGEFSKGEFLKVSCVY